MKKNVAKIVALVVVVVMCAVVLAACVPSDFSKAKENLKGNGYSVVLIENDKLVNKATVAGEAIAGIYGVKLEGTCTQYISATKDKESINIYYFDNAKDAKALKNAVKAAKDELNEEIKKEYEDGKLSKEDYEAAKEDIKNAKFGASGKVFYTGTAAAVKAAN